MHFLTAPLQSLFSSSKNTLRDDLLAGTTVALVLIPQSLAYAQLAGLPPHYGLYASLLPPIIAAIFGSSTHLSTGPVAVVSLMTLAAISPLASPSSPEFISYAILLALILGIFLLTLGFLKLGELVSFLSHPVVYGFTNAAALIIATTQLSIFLGVTVSSQPHHYQTVIAVLNKGLYSLNWATFSLGIFSLLCMIGLRMLNRKLPAILVVTIGITIFTWFFDYPTQLIGELTRGLPTLIIPRLDSVVLSHFTLPVITIALIGFTEAISVAQAIAIKTKQRLDPNQELIGQGLANVLGSFSQSYAVSGSFSRTALNYHAGGKTWLSSVFTSLLVFLTLLFFTNVLAYLPKVVLAAVIIFSVASLIDFKKILAIWSVSKYDAAAALLTFLGTLYFAPDLEKGVLLGVTFSISHFVYRSTHPRVAFLSRSKEGGLHDARQFHLDRCENIAVVRLDAPLFFANAVYFENEIIKDLSQHQHISDILFVASGINEIDATGAEMLTAFFTSLNKSNKNVYFSHVKSQVMEILTKSSLVNRIGKDHFFPSTSLAVKFMINHLNHQKAHQDQQHCPLLEYIHLPSSALSHQRSRRELVAYFYQKIFTHH